MEQDTRSSSLTDHVVMIVSEDGDIRRLMASTLRRAGFAVVEAATGHESLDHAQHPVDLVVADVLTEGLTRFELVRRLRLRYPDLKVLHLGNHHVSGADVDACLHKPFYLEELSEAVNAFIWGRCRCPSCLRRDRLVSAAWPGTLFVKV
jgi:two-component system, OmpR family, response regulator